MDLADRIALCRVVLADIPGVEVDGFNELLVDYVRRKEAGFILRGIRTVADFE